jgi:Tfp pilus assembly protein PilN
VRPGSDGRVTISWNFARRPFRDDRPVFLAVGVMLVAAVVLLVANARLYTGFQRSVAGTSRQIEYLEKRRTVALKESEEARSALNSYRVSNLASESKGMLRVVGERHFSWTALLARLERVLPPEVRVARLTPAFGEQGVSIKMGLIGKDADSIVSTIAALARDPAFSVIDLMSESTPEQGVPEGHSFDVDVRYLPPQHRGTVGR